MTHNEMNGCGGHLDDAGPPLLAMLLIGLLSLPLSWGYHAIFDEPQKDSVFWMDQAIDEAARNERLRMLGVVVSE